MLPVDAGDVGLGTFSAFRITLAASSISTRTRSKPSFKRSVAPTSRLIRLSLDAVGESIRFRMKLVDALCLASVIGLRREAAESGMAGTADGVEETDLLPRRLETVDRQPGALDECVEAAREGVWEGGSDVLALGMPKPRAVEKKDDFEAGVSLADGVVMGSGSVVARSALGGMGERE